MSTFELTRPRKDINFSGTADPLNTTPAKVGQSYQNTTSGEIFHCTDDTGAVYTWMGTLGTQVLPLAAILTTDHPNLQVLYTMDSVDITGSTILDKSQYSRDGTLISSPTQSTGVIGDSLQIETVSTLNDKGIYIPDSDFGVGNGGAAISVWFYKPGNWNPSIVTYYIVNRGSVYVRTAGLLTLSVYPRGADGTIRYRFYAYGGNATSDAVAEFSDSGGSTRYVDQWVHLVGTYSPNGELAIYLNGEKKTAYADRVGDTIVNPDTSGLWTGTTVGYANVANDGNESRTWVGELDQIRIFNRGVTPEEITALYQEGL